MPVRLRRALLVTLLLAALIAAAIIAVRAATRPTAPCGCSSYPGPTTSPAAPAAR